MALIDTNGLIGRIQRITGCNFIKANEVVEASPTVSAIPMERIKQLRGGIAWKNPKEVMPKSNTLVDVLVDTGMTQSYMVAYWNDLRNDWEQGLGGIKLLSKDLGYEVIGWRDIEILELLDNMIKEYEGGE